MLLEKGNNVLGRGKVLFREAGSGAYRYIVSTPSFTINVETETAELWTSDTPVREKMVDTETQRSYSGSFEAHDINAANLAIFFGGEVETVEQDGGTVADEEITAVAGGIHQLGVDATHPRGKRDLSAVVIDDGDTTTYDEGDDYTIDLRRGLLHIVEGGAIADGAAIEANYSYGTTSYKSVKSTGKQSSRGEIKFIAENAEGNDVDFILPNCTIRADGDFGLKSEDEFQALSFTVDINTDDNGNAIITEDELD